MDNTGRLYKNPKFTEGSKLPRYIGQAVIDGLQKNISAWVKKDKNGNSFMSISFTKAQKKVSEKITVKNTTNKEGVRSLSKIAEGKKVAKIKTADIEVTGIPF